MIAFGERDGAGEVTDFQQGSNKVLLDISVGINHIDSFAELRQLGEVTSDNKSVTVTFDVGDSLTRTGVSDLKAAD